MPDIIEVWTHWALRLGFWDDCGNWDDNSAWDDSPNTGMYIDP